MTKAKAKAKLKTSAASKRAPESASILSLASQGKSKKERDAEAKRAKRATEKAAKDAAAALNPLSSAVLTPKSGKGKGKSEGTGEGAGEDGENEVSISFDDMAKALPSITILFEQIVLDKDFNSRKEYRGIEALSEDIQELGLISALVVSRDPKDPNRYFLVAGFRRTLAIMRLREEARKKGAEMLPYDQIEVKLHEGPEIGRWILNLRENMSRVDLHAWEIGDQCVKIRERFQLSGAQIGEKLSYQKSHVNNCIRVVERIAKDVQEQFRAGKAEPPFNLLTNLAAMNLADGKPDHERQRVKWNEWLSGKAGPSAEGGGEGDDGDDDEHPSGKMRRLREAEKLLGKLEEGLKESTRESDREYFRGAIGVAKYLMGIVQKIKRVSFASK